MDNKSIFFIIQHTFGLLDSSSSVMNSKMLQRVTWRLEKYQFDVVRKLYTHILKGSRTFFEFYQFQVLRKFNF